METKYLRLEELADATRLPAAWLKREADAGRLPHIRAGRLRMFNLAAVMQALADRQESKVARV
jgi:excisionase family DNA binding protein